MANDDGLEKQCWETNTILKGLLGQFLKRFFYLRNGFHRTPIAGTFNCICDHKLISHLPASTARSLNNTIECALEFTHGLLHATNFQKC